MRDNWKCKGIYKFPIRDSLSIYVNEYLVCRNDDKINEILKKIYECQCCIFFGFQQSKIRIFVVIARIHKNKNRQILTYLRKSLLDEALTLQGLADGLNASIKMHDL